MVPPLPGRVEIRQVFDAADFKTGDPRATGACRHGRRPRVSQAHQHVEETRDAIHGHTPGGQVREAGGRPEQGTLDAMTKYHEDGAKAGIVLDGTGLQPSSKRGAREDCGGKATVRDRSPKRRSSSRVSR